MFVQEYVRGIFQPIRWVVKYSMAKVIAGDLAFAARMLSKMSQTVALLVFVQTTIVIVAAYILVLGLKVQ